MIKTLLILCWKVSEGKNVLMLAKVLDKINSLSKSNHKLGIVGDGEYKNKIQEFDCVEYFGLKTRKK